MSIPVFIYFAAYSNSIVGIRCALTKQTYFKQGFNQLNLEIQKKEMEKVIFEMGFKQAIGNWIEKIVIKEHKNIMINILDRVKIEAFLLFTNKKFSPILTPTTQIELRKFPFL